MQSAPGCAMAGSEHLIGFISELSWFLRLCKRTQRAPGCAMARSEIFLGSSARFPKVELSWFLRLCKRTQSAPGCAMVGSKHFGFISEVPKR